MKATVIIDNNGNDITKGEWGLSIYVEYNGKKVLLDAGASELYSENAKLMGMDIEEVDFAVLSHAHYDHGNGFIRFFDDNKKASLYVKESCKANCYKKTGIFKKEYIGIPKDMLDKYKERIKYVSGRHEIAEGISLIPHTTKDLYKIGIREKMFVKEGSKFVPDEFAHEQSLVFDTEKGLVVFNSCSHGGAVNIINEVAAAYSQKEIFAYIGGLHLFNKTDEEVFKLASRIKETKIKHIYTGHCTGDKAFGILKAQLGEMVEQLKVGLVMEF